ncbi:hypothetical protein MESS2_10052 [Mesorhizobium metallidurans STM 2683]|uniref:Uncharacterized protein n=1 Tax=Mesorhizobium metallidurans STM 2683 TaxID=1297569 RepID=M5ETG5_9HYPH|nr:hypothetical protein MESS2_10052 [Mesorhizobium metallidurans STM 2683]
MCCHCTLRRQLKAAGTNPKPPTRSPLLIYRRNDVKARVTTYNIAAHASTRHDRQGFPVPLRLNALRSRRNS